MSLIQVSIKKIKKSKYLKRKHNQEQIQFGCMSLQNHGQYQPIIVSNNEILCGNLIYQCAKILGWKKIWVYQMGELSEQKKRQIRFIDNHSFQTSSWKDDKLKQFLMQLDVQRLRDFCFDQDFAYSYINDLDEELIKQVKQKCQNQQIYYCQKCGWRGKI